MGASALAVPPTRKIDFVSCLRASEAKLREHVSERCSSTLGLRMRNVVCVSVCAAVRVCVQAVCVRLFVSAHLCV